MPTWWVRYHVEFEIDRGSDGTQIVKRDNDMTIADANIHTEEQVHEHIKDLYTNSDDPIVDLNDPDSIPVDDVLSETLKIDETVLVIKYEP